MSINEPVHEFESICEVQEYGPEDPYHLSVNLTGIKEDDDILRLAMRQVPQLFMEAGRVYRLTVRMERLADPVADEVKKKAVYWMAFTGAIQNVDAGALAAPILTTSALDNTDDEAFYTWAKGSPYHVHQLLKTNSERTRMVVYFLSKEPHLSDEQLGEWLGW